jgi:two-component system, NtrC family, response regulator AtoC
VNCAALAPSLVESELFGHEKGAFTGAQQRRLGRFELAHGGTLFLDEIGELPLDAQVKLLRALQEREVERVGGGKPIAIDVRVIAATHRDLAADVKAGRFRSDLFYRLNVFPITIPPLRDRREDIPELADHALRGHDASIESDALLYLQSYDWPGNVRELQNVLERAAILAHGKPITIAELPELRAAAEPAAGESLKQRVEAFERAAIVAALAQANGNQSEAARSLHTSRATLQYKLKLYGL